MVSIERKNKARKIFLGKFNPPVGLKPLNNLLKEDLAPEAKVKIAHIHVLTV